MSASPRRLNGAIRAGLGSLIVASASHWFLPSATWLSRDWSDGVQGLFYGLAIGFMLLALWRSHTQTSPGSGCTPA